MCGLNEVGSVEGTTSANLYNKCSCSSRIEFGRENTRSWNPP